MKRLISLVILAFLSCSRQSIVKVPQDLKSYESQITEWQNSRERSIKSPKGWLSVVGLHWLQEGRNTLGSSDDSDIVLPENANAKVGDLYLENGELYFKSHPESTVKKDDKVFKEGNLNSDASIVPTELNHKSLYFYVIRRGSKFGLRVKNTLAPARFDFEGIDNFNIDPNYRYVGKVKTDNSRDSILINDISGISTKYRIDGVVEITHKGKPYTLIAFDGGNDRYFITFTDVTSGNLTYPGGRFLYVDKTIEGENVIVDFNQAYNPPCAFTDYATCPIPPLQNHLDFQILSGEKKVGTH